MPQFDVLVTRDTTESVVIRVEADEDGGAFDAATERARRDYALVWNRDDCMGGEPYIADPEEAAEPIEAPAVLDVLAQAYLDQERVAAKGTRLVQVVIVEECARIWWIQRDVEVFGRTGLSDNRGHLDVPIADLLAMPAARLTADLVAAGDSLADTLEEAIGQHIYDFGSGDEQPDDCGYQKAVDDWRAVSPTPQAGA